MSKRGNFSVLTEHEDLSGEPGAIADREFASAGKNSPLGWRSSHAPKSA